MSIDYSDVESFEDIVEYEPTLIDANPQSRSMLSRVAGGDYWMEIVSDYKNGIINGYQAECRFSKGYKQMLREKYKYVLDMPIRLNPKHRPKYRMVHATNHVGGCVLMANNMAKRSDELFLEIQQKGQLAIFGCDVENEIINYESLSKKIEEQLTKYPSWIHLDQFLSEFFSDNGLICKPADVREQLIAMESKAQIDVDRKPNETKNKTKTRFFSESRDQSVCIKIKT